MPTKSAKKTKSKKETITLPEPKDKLLPRLTLAFFDRAKLTLFLWIILTLFGAASYATFLRREGFPSVTIPVAIVGGTYFVNDASKVDSEVAKPLADAALKRDDVASVQTTSAANFFSVAIQYKEGTDSKASTDDLKKTIETGALVPQQTQIRYNVPYFGVTGGDVEQLDLAISFYDDDNSETTSELAAAAQTFADRLKSENISGVKDVFVKNPFDTAIDPASGQPVVIQKNFDRYAQKESDSISFRRSVVIGVAAKENVDALKLDKNVSEALERIESKDFNGYSARISASFAPQIKDNINELQKVLLEGLLAVLIVGSIVIAVRASLITVISMITVLALSLGFLYLFGYSLNVITLFSLILSLSLIVDDTIIMVEAIDAARHHTKDRRKAVKVATRKVSRAMVAATLTAGLSFAPLLFVGGVLGSFIRAIPITIIASLLISLVVALLFIPLFARFLLLGSKQMGAKGVTEVASGFENAVAAFVTKPMVWARHSRKKLFGVGLTAVMIGLAFIGAGLYISRNVIFNIFPPTKDTNGLVVQLSFPQGTTVESAEQIAEEADRLIATELGDNLEQIAYYNTGSAQSATVLVGLTPYGKREPTSQQLARQLQAKFDESFNKAKAAIGQQDVGPPASAFIVQIDATDRQAALNAANDVRQFLETVELKRPNNTTARLVNVSVSSADQYLRSGTQPILTVSAGFTADDTSTLVALAQSAVEDNYTAEKVSSLGLTSQEAISFNLGQESENQDSFKTLALAFPVMLFVMYLLLALQFRSLLQPLLIFMAIPFSLFGIMLGLDLTDNAISFFAMLGFFALIGLSIKNTILVTDFANQARQAGKSPVDAAVEAVRERFRPLFATSVTAVVSLIPLALTSPFWEGLAVVLIFGLVSSTFLVVTVFPYYYLGAEFLRHHISARRFWGWLIPAAALTYVVAMATTVTYALATAPLGLLIFQVIFHRRFVSRSKK